MSTPLEIRSFRAVFALERRIYRIDTFRLNPGGVPLRGIVYAAAFVLLALVAGALPPTSVVDPLIPWYVREVAGPVALAILFGSLRIDGRPAHLAAGAIIRLSFRARRLHRLARATPGRHWRPPDVVVIPDGSDAGFRRIRFRGPGVVRVGLDHVCGRAPAFARADVVLRPSGLCSSSPTLVELEAGAVLEVRSR